MSCSFNLTKWLDSQSAATLFSICARIQSLPKDDSWNHVLEAAQTRDTPAS